MMLQTIISIEPDPGTNTQSRSHFLGALSQIGADQGHEHRTQGKGPCPCLLGQITQIAAGNLLELQEVGAPHNGILVNALEMRFVPKARALEFGRPLRSHASIASIYATPARCHSLRSARADIEMAATAQATGAPYDQ